MILDLGRPFPYARTPPLTSSRALRQVLDVRTKARQFDFTQLSAQRLLDGSTSVQWLLRTVVYLLMTPLRVVLVCLYGLGQLLNECPRHTIGDQPRIVRRVLHATVMAVIKELQNYMLPILYPRVHVRTFNISDLRTASFYTQRSIPASAVQGLFGWFLPTHSIRRAVPVKNMSGLCWGKTLWIAAMSLHTEYRCPDLHQRVRALSLQHQLGAPPEAALLQALGDSVITQPIDTIPVFERLMNRMVEKIKPLFLMSVWRGVKEYGQRLCSGSRSYISLGKAIENARACSQQALIQLREQASLAKLVNLRVCETRRFTSDARSLSRAGGKLDTHPFAGIERMADGTYLVTTESENSMMRHSILYMRSHSGHRGIFLDPNVGLETDHAGKRHWKALPGMARRYGHDTLTLTRFERRSLCDLSSLDLRRRMAELTL